MSVRMTVWVDDLDDLAEFVDQLPDGTAPTVGRDDEGWYLAVDLTTVDANQLTLDDVDLDDGAGASIREDEDLAPVEKPADPLPPAALPEAGYTTPAPSTSQLEQQILEVLREAEKATAAEIADDLELDVDLVKDTLRRMRDGDMVELAGVRGWKIRHRQFSHEAARAAAAI